MSYKKNVFFLLSMLVMVIPLESRSEIDQKEDVIQCLNRIYDSIKELVEVQREDSKENIENYKRMLECDRKNLFKKTDQILDNLGLYILKATGMVCVTALLGMALSLKYLA